MEYFKKNLKVTLEYATNSEHNAARANWAIQYLN